MKQFFTRNPELLVVAFGAAVLAGATVHATVRAYTYREGQVECIGSDGKPGLKQHFDSVYRDPNSRDMVLVGADHSRTTVPKSCMVTLKPYAHS